MRNLLYMVRGADPRDLAISRLAHLLLWRACVAYTYHWGGLTSRWDRDRRMLSHCGRWPNPERRVRGVPLLVSRLHFNLANRLWPRRGPVNVGHVTVYRDAASGGKRFVACHQEPVKTSAGDEMRPFRVKDTPQEAIASLRNALVYITGQPWRVLVEEHLDTLLDPATERYAPFRPAQ